MSRPGRLANWTANSVGSGSTSTQIPSAAGRSAGSLAVAGAAAIVAVTAAAAAGDQAATQGSLIQTRRPTFLLLGGKTGGQTFLSGANVVCLNKDRQECLSSCGELHGPLPVVLWGIEPHFFVSLSSAIINPGRRAPACKAPTATEARCRSRRYSAALRHRSRQRRNSPASASSAA